MLFYVCMVLIFSSDQYCTLFDVFTAQQPTTSRTRTSGTPQDRSSRPYSLRKKASPISPPTETISVSDSHPLHGL